MLSYYNSQPEQALEKITAFKTLEAENDVRKAAISSLRLDASNIEAIRQLKGKIKQIVHREDFIHSSRFKAIHR